MHFLIVFPQRRVEFLTVLVLKFLLGFTNAPPAVREDSRDFKTNNLKTRDMTNIKSNIAGCRFSAEELGRMLPYVSAVVKQVMGVANNVVQVAMMNARDDLRKHPQYRQRVKQVFKKAFGEWDAYEKVLINSTGVCYFHVADMSAEVKKRYTNLTDREYYEFWQNIGYSV